MNEQVSLSIVLKKLVVAKHKENKLVVLFHGLHLTLFLKRSHEKFSKHLSL